MIKKKPIKRNPKTKRSPKVSPKKRQVSKINKKKPITTKTFTKVKKQRNMYLFLIPTFLLIGIFLSIAVMKNANVVFTANLIDGSDKPSGIELVYEHNGQIRSLQLSEVAQKIPKSSDLLYFRAFRNETAVNTSINEDYQITENFTFEVSQSSANIEFEEGFNFNNISSQWYSSGNRLHKQLIMEFRLNKTYLNVKNLTFSFDFATNYTSGDLLDDFDVEYWDFKKNQWSEDKWDEDDLISGELSITNATVEFPCVYLNRTFIDNTTFKVRIYARERFTGGEVNYDFNISNVFVYGHFWKEVNVSSPIYVFSSLEYNREIQITNTIEIIANQFIFTTLVILNETISFGSWIESSLTIWNSTSILTEDIQVFDIEDDNLAIDSYLGLRECIVNINSIDFNTHTIDYDIDYGGISF